jgi:hypothetical protein
MESQDIAELSDMSLNLAEKLPQYQEKVLNPSDSTRVPILRIQMEEESKRFGHSPRKKNFHDLKRTSNIPMITRRNFKNPKPDEIRVSSNIFSYSSI